MEMSRRRRSTSSRSSSTRKGRLPSISQLMIQLSNSNDEASASEPMNLSNKRASTNNASPPVNNTEMRYVSAVGSKGSTREEKNPAIDGFTQQNNNYLTPGEMNLGMPPGMIQGIGFPVYYPISTPPQPPIPPSQAPTGLPTHFQHLHSHQHDFFTPHQAHGPPKFSYVPVHNMGVGYPYPPQPTQNVYQTNVNFQEPTFYIPVNNVLPLPTLQTANSGSTSTSATLPTGSSYSTSPTNQSIASSGVKKEVDSDEYDEDAEESIQDADSDLCICSEPATSQHQHIPRPRNAFILFRQHWHQQIFAQEKEKLSTDTNGVASKLGSFKANSQASRDIGQRWRCLPDSERQHWLDLAKQEKEAHRKKYPDYKYVPTRRTKRRPSSAGTGSAGSNTPGSSTSSLSAQNRCQTCDKPKR